LLLLLLLPHAAGTQDHWCVGNRHINSMANQAVRLWEAVLQGLTDAACGHLPAGNVQQLVIRLSDMPAQPKATWKRLVLDMQVRRPSRAPAIQAAF
jgi:hypothetical protein